MEQCRIHLKNCLEQKGQLEKMYVSYEPDKNNGVPYYMLKTNQWLRTLPVNGGWHLVFCDKTPYLISHLAIDFNSRSYGYEDWRNYRLENAQFLRYCYSNRSLGTKGTYFTVPQYKQLSSWVQTTAGTAPIFLGTRRLTEEDELCQIAYACGTNIGYDTLVNGGKEFPSRAYSFRPVVQLDENMLLIIDEEHNGSTPENGMWLEPANGYEPNSFEIGILAGKQELNEWSELMGALKQFVRSPIYGILKPILDSFEKE